MIYLDHNASSPLHPAARAAMLEALDLPANAHSVHAAGQRAFGLVEAARRRLAEVFGVEHDRVVYTSGATEANALALASRSRACGGPGWRISAVEHPSVRAWGDDDLIPVDGRGVVNLDALGEGRGLAVMLANNETGVIQPVADVIAAARRAGVPVHIDATQGPGRMAMPSGLWDADTVAISAHKYGGPQGVGALIVRRGHTLAPLLRGGPQERGRRAGTLNVAGIVGMTAAASALVAPDASLRDALEAGVVALGARVVGSGAERLSNTSCAAFEGRDAADLVIALDLHGICVSAGAACASGSTERSVVLTAMGVAGSAVRFSLGPTTTSAEVAATLRALGAVLGEPSV